MSTIFNYLVDFIGTLSGESTSNRLKNLLGEAKIHSINKHSSDCVVDQHSFQYFSIYDDNNTAKNDLIDRFDDQCLHAR